MVSAGYATNTANEAGKIRPATRVRPPLTPCLHLCLETEAVRPSDIMGDREFIHTSGPRCQSRSFVGLWLYKVLAMDDP